MRTNILDPHPDISLSIFGNNKCVVFSILLNSLMIDTILFSGQIYLMEVGNCIISFENNQRYYYMHESFICKKLSSILGGGLYQRKGEQYLKWQFHILFPFKQTNKQTKQCRTYCLYCEYVLIACLFHGNLES